MSDMGTEEAGGGARTSGLVMKLFLVLLGLAGLGVGVWLFGRRRRSGQ